MENLQTTGTLGPNEGRVGYFHVTQPGEELLLRKEIRIESYEGNQNPISI